jgi:hypothetical protein
MARAIAGLGINTPAAIPEELMQRLMRGLNPSQTMERWIPFGQPAASNPTPGAEPQIFQPLSPDDRVFL